MNCGISQDSILYSLYIEVWIPYMAGEKDLLNKSCSPAIFKHLIDPILIALSWLTISPLSPVFPSAHPFIHLNTLLRRFKLNPMCSVHPKLLLICQARSVCVCMRVWRECTCRIVTALADRFQYAQSFTKTNTPCHTLTAGFSTLRQIMKYLYTFQIQQMYDNVLARRLENITISIGPECSCFSRILFYGFGYNWESS